MSLAIKYILTVSSQEGRVAIRTVVNRAVDRILASNVVMISF